MRARQVDGFITATARLDHELLSELSDSGQPIVLVNRRVEDGALPAVAADDRGGVRLAVEHLTSLGHRRIAHLGGPQNLSTGHQRHLGSSTRWRRSAPYPTRTLPSASAFTEAEGARLCRELLGASTDVTAIVAGNDLMALGCYDVLAERGLRCPDDVSVVGFNDMPFADRFHPPLTTVRIPHREMGAAAADVLLELLADPGTPPRQLILAVALEVRGSTAPVRA